MSISFSGLASGFDSASYIKAIMAQESIPITKLQTKIDNSNAFRGVFSTMNTKLVTLKDAALALKDAASFTATKATSSDTTKLSVTNSGSSLAGDYTVEVTDLAKAQVTASKTFASGADFTDITGSLTIPLSTPGSKSIDLSGTEFQGKTNDEALALLAQKINAIDNTAVKAAVVQTAPGVKQLVLTGVETGKAFTAGGPASFWGTDNVTDAGPAKLKVNGLEIESESNTVQDAVPGVTLTLTGTGTSAVKVVQDVDQITNKIDAFVSAYNAVIDQISTNTQKSVTNANGSMSLTLQGDSTIRGLRTQLGDWVNSLFPTGGPFKILSEVGLEVDKGVTSAALMTGKLSFDKDKFKQALGEDPAAVQHLFTGSNDGAVAGVGQFFADKLKSWTDSVDGYMVSRIKGYDADISFMKEQIDSMQNRLDKREADLKRRYANLEVVMSQLNSQKNWISTQTTLLTNATTSN